MEIMKRLFTEEEGQGLVEYVLIVGVVVVIAAAVSTSGVGEAIGAKLLEIVGGAEADPEL